MKILKQETEKIIKHPSLPARIPNSNPLNKPQTYLPITLPTWLLTTIYAPELVTLDSSFPLVLPGPNTQPYTDDCSNG